MTTNHLLRRPALWTLAICITASAGLSAQKPVSVSLDTVFYGDNGEFFSPFRTGETILGSWQRIDTAIEVSDKATLKLGLYGLERNGSELRTELARPVVSLTLGTKRHRFVMGTIETGDRAGFGPDRTTPHGLLPPLAEERQWFSRAYEAGIQWRSNTEKFTQDVWFDYQKVITSQYREKFDGGIVGRAQASATAPIALLYQFHVVHHGGQQFDVGPVSDSFGYGPGVMLRREMPLVGAATLEAYELFSHDRPDRQVDELTVKGNATFVRLAAEQNNWRAHAIGWWGHSFKHEDGDPNYLSYLYKTQENYLGHREYAEAGLTRLFRPAPTVDFEVSGRAHLVQGKWGYSYRLLGTLHVALWRTETKRGDN